MLNNGNSLGLPTFFFFLRKKGDGEDAGWFLTPYVLLVHPIYQTVVLKTTIPSLVVLRYLSEELLE